MATITLSKPFLDALDNEPVASYRAQYARFRHGESRGARGEEPETEVPGANLEDDDDWDIEGDDKEIFKEIAAYRLDYRAHRCGAHHGAKGEVTGLAGKMGKRHAMMLPVSQLASLARMRVAASALESVKSAFHIHLGAGKLGLGLVVPAIHASTFQSYAVVQRRSSSWAPLVGQPKQDDPAAAAAAVADGGPRTIDICINKEPVAAGLTLVTKAADIVTAADGGCPRMFVCTDDQATLDAIVSRAQTFSIALGPAMSDVVLPLLKDLQHKPAGKRPCLYACENDHKAVHALTEALEGRVDVVNCMVDRICSGRSVCSGQIEVEAEPYSGEIVVIAPPEHVPLPPFSGSGVRMPRLEAEAEYLCQRKIIMVNGMHTTLAFLTLLEKEPGQLVGDGWKDHALLVPEQASAEVQRTIFVWAVARLLFVFWEHEPAIIKQTHGVESDTDACNELLGYAKATLKRYGTVKDKVGRVLGGGVQNRWQGRLKMIESFLDNEPRIHGIQRRMLQLAGVEEAELRSRVSKLVEETRRFVGVSVKKTAHVSG